MRHRFLLMTLIALGTLLGALGARVSAPPTSADTIPPLNGLHQLDDWMTYGQGDFGPGNPADPISVAIYGPGSMDATALQNHLEDGSWADVDDPLVHNLDFTYKGDGRGAVGPDFTMTNNPKGDTFGENGNRISAAFWGPHAQEAHATGFTFYAAAISEIPCSEGHCADTTANIYDQSRDQLATHIEAVFRPIATVQEFHVGNLGTTGVGARPKDGISGFDGQVTAICVDPGHTDFCNASQPKPTAPPATGGGQPALSVAFDHDTYQGGSADNIQLAPGQTSDPITVVFQNTSQTNTLYQANVVLANFQLNTDQPARLDLCEPSVERTCMPFTTVTMDQDCPPRTLCSFTYQLHAPADFSGTENVTWRMAVVDPNNPVFKGWINDANNQPTYEVYTVTAAG